MSSNRFVAFLVFLLLCSQLGSALVKVLQPDQYAGEYPEANLNIDPREFHVIGSVVLADPPNACGELKNADKVNGKIVLAIADTRCGSTARARFCMRANATGLVIHATGSSRGHLGIFYYLDEDYDPRVVLPSLNFIDANEMVDSLKENPSMEVVIEMRNTDRNPWKTTGQSAVGILFQIYFELLLGGTFFLAAYKLASFIKHKGVTFNLTQSVLALEMVAAFGRILYQTNPLAWWPSTITEAGKAFASGYARFFAVSASLLIIFYWHEVTTKVSKQLSNAVLENLDKLRIPFIIICVIIFALETVSSLGRGFVISLPGENVYVVATLVIMIIQICTSAFYIYTSRKVLKFKFKETSRSTKRLSRFTIFIFSCAICDIGSIIGIILYLSPLTSINQWSCLFVYWFWWSFAYLSSLAKVCAFDNPSLFGSTGLSSTNTPASELRMEKTTASASSTGAASLDKDDEHESV